MYEGATRRLASCCFSQPSLFCAGAWVSRWGPRAGKGRPTPVCVQAYKRGRHSSCRIRFPSELSARPTVPTFHSPRRLPYILASPFLPSRSRVLISNPRPPPYGYWWPPILYSTTRLHPSHHAIVFLQFEALSGINHVLDRELDVLGAGNLRSGDHSRFAGAGSGVSATVEE